MPPPTIYQFHVWLRGISPLIWRRLLLRSDQSVADLHYALQLAFGWSDCHLHRFRIHGKEFGVHHEGGPGVGKDSRQMPMRDRINDSKHSTTVIVHEFS
jgi:Plasmid pRiA4b ORF-3-like protein